MEYAEWSYLKKNHDIVSTLITGYVFDDGSKFIMEPAFYTQLQGLKALHPNDYQKVIDKINEIVKNNKKVFFTAEYEAPFVNLEGYIYLEITDITDPLHIFVEDKSRGSDYGD